MVRVLKILETNLKSEEIINFYLVFLQISMRLSSRLPCFVLIFFISRKRYSIGEVLKHIFFQNLGITKVLAVERDVKPRNMNFAKLQRMGGINMEVVFIRINTVNTNMKHIQQ